MADSKFTFKGKLALITGGSSGIGLALAKLLAAEGARVWILARHAGRLKAALSSLASVNGNQPGMLTADVSDWHQVEKALKRLQDEAGLPDLLINAAGETHPGYVQEIPLEKFRQLMDIDYFGTVHTVKALLPAMLDRGSGYIVNISSGAGYLGLFGYTAYGAAKYAVRGFSDVLRAEVKPLGIHVSVVFPPDTDTPQLAYENKFKPFETRAITGNGGVLPADKVAKDILRGVERGKYVIVPGLQNSIAYRLSGLLGSGLYPIMDWLVADARKKKNKA
jgi:3-dehydrosphinganine reductase